MAVAPMTWDEFWDSQQDNTPPAQMIRGVEVVPPTDLPLGVMSKLDKLTESSDLRDAETLTTDVFGEGVYGKWVDAGMGFVELQTVLAWGIAHGSGTPLTFAEARDRITEQVAAGKAPAPANRAERRAASRARPTSATGGPSRRTSNASTASAKRTSRR